MKVAERRGKLCKKETKTTRGKVMKKGKKIRKGSEGGGKCRHRSEEGRGDRNRGGRGAVSQGRREKER